MFISIDDQLINVWNIVSIFESFPHQIWISLTDGQNLLVPQFATKEDLERYISREMKAKKFPKKIDRIINET